MSINNSSGFVSNCKPLHFGIVIVWVVRSALQRDFQSTTCVVTHRTKSLKSGTTKVKLTSLSSGTSSGSILILNVSETSPERKWRVPPVGKTSSVARTPAINKIFKTFSHLHANPSRHNPIYFDCRGLMFFNSGQDCFCFRAACLGHMKIYHIKIMKNHLKKS